MYKVHEEAFLSLIDNHIMQQIFKINTETNVIKWHIRRRTCNKTSVNRTLVQTTELHTCRVDKALENATEVHKYRVDKPLVN